MYPGMAETLYTLSLSPCLKDGQLLRLLDTSPAACWPSHSVPLRIHVVLAPGFCLVALARGCHGWIFSCRTAGVLPLGRDGRRDFG
jgi:hypothetical protein